jgi:MFS family permease
MPVLATPARIGLSARVCVATLAAYLTADCVAPISGSLGGGLDPSAVVVPFCAAFALAFPAWGRAGDKHAAGRVLGLSLGLLALGGLALVVAPSAATVVAARALEGAAAAGVPPTAQALLAARAGNHAAGRAVSSMLIMVAVATLAGPAAASALVVPLGARATIVLLAVLPALAAAVLCAPMTERATARRGRLAVTRPLVAGWVCSTLVLAAYWTLVTRWSSLATGAGFTADVSALLPVAGALGIALLVIAGRSADRRGPMLPMVWTMGLGALALVVAAASQWKLVYLLGMLVALALYWSYLPVVSVQIQRSADADVRATAAGILYSSMWLGAALGGLAAVAAPSVHYVVGGAAVAWAAAGIVAWRGFHRVPHAA